jgi:hypothetical protein
MALNHPRARRHRHPRLPTDLPYFPVGLKSVLKQIPLRHPPFPRK